MLTAVGLSPGGSSTVQYSTHLHKSIMLLQFSHEVSLCGGRVNNLYVDAKLVFILIIQHSTQYTVPDVEDY